MNTGRKFSRDGERGSAMVIAVLVMAVLAACIFPLRKATGVDATIALRCE